MRALLEDRADGLNVFCMDCMMQTAVKQETLITQ